MSKYANIRRATSPNLKTITKNEDECSKLDRESLTTDSNHSLSSDDERDCRSRKNYMETNPETLVVDEIKSKIINILQYREKIELNFNNSVEGLQSELNSIEKENTILKTVMTEMKGQIKEMKADINKIQKHLQFNDCEVMEYSNFQKNNKPKERRTSKSKQNKLFRFSSTKSK